MQPITRYEPLAAAPLPRRLADELQQALRGIPAEEWAHCVRPLPAEFGLGLARRAGNAAGALRQAGRFLAGKAAEGADAARRGDLGGFLRQAGADLTRSVRTEASALAAAAGQIPSVGRLLARDPGRILPEIIGAVFGFLAGSGGLDGNGGLPDLDLALGVGFHRSALTHSVLIGCAAEAVLLSLDRAVALVHRHLPRHHDPAWDELLSYFQRTTRAARGGTSVGLAFHLGVDGLLQPAAVKGLPFAAPMALHQAFLAGNAALEAAALPRSEPQRRPAPEKIHSEDKR